MQIRNPPSPANIKPQESVTPNVTMLQGYIEVVQHQRELAWTWRSKNSDNTHTGKFKRLLRG